jgi:hypothetical protein
MRMHRGPVDPSHDLDPAVLHPTHGQNPIRDTLQTIGPTSNHDDLQAEVVVDVHVQGGPNLLAQLVL